ncbi:DUF3426 domain-containing protein [Telluria mixta]|uniref:DUF3426 domain-containing protein n=1 Tax=Telluria mixta TaxID=34071 RepID=A0ABT2C333_9BURK|nr:DUF3426 domain-containing protein [Telluria mixta]MCS0631800.1 DUF3426 domain-containing protein [Telluria mixta]WEM98547.1 DUF3426 domain-containing protein [Telluria mixta]
MALATQCPHCHTTFRVAADQLKLRGGIVRCGSCQRIFDGNAHLIDLDKPATPAPVQEDDALPVYTLDFDHTFDPLGILPKPADDVPEPPRAHVWRRAPEAEEAPETAAVEAPVAADYAPADRVEPQLEAVVHAAPDTEPEPEPEPAEDVVAEPPPASAYAPADRIEPSFDLPVTEEIVAQPLPDYEPEAEPEPEPEPEPQPEPVPEPPAPPSDAPPFLPLRASAASEPPAPAPAMIPPVVKPARSKAARATEARGRRSKLTPTKIEPPKLRLAAEGDTDEPEFVKRSRRQERMGRTQRMLMAAGAVVLLLMLLAQAVLGFRNTLAAQHPGLKPALGAACAVLGCRVELPAQAENLVIETGELTTLGPNTYALNTLLRNQGSLVLAWPSIELELTDASDKPVLRRVLAPADYLPRGTSPASGFGPHSEQPVTLHFTLDGLQPSGYHTFVFYP